jgi:hypothetical protein
MGLHCPFEHLKHKLWPKKRSGVKLPIWFPTTKSQELTQFPCVQVACHIPLEIYRQGLQLCFKPHHDRRSAREVMRPQSCGSPNCGNFGSPGTKKDIWMWPLWRGVEYTIRGKVVASPKSGPWWILCVRVACGSS